MKTILNYLKKLKWIIFGGLVEYNPPLKCKDGKILSDWKKKRFTF